MAFEVTWLLHLTFGVVVGFGVGLGYTASIVAVGEYFEKRRPLALGLTFLGSAASGMILAPIFTFTME